MQDRNSRAIIRAMRYIYPVLGVGVGIGIFYAASVSLWTLLSLLPYANDPDALVAFRRDVLVERVLEYPAVGEVLSDVAPEARLFSRIAIIRKGEGVAIAGLPHIVDQLHVSDLLVSNGWSVTRLGHLVIARKGIPESGRVSIAAVQKGLHAIWQNVAIQRAPLAPLVIVHVRANTFSMINKSQHVVIWRNGTAVCMAGTSGDGAVAAPSFPCRALLEQAPDAFLFSAPGWALNVLPREMRDALEHHIRERFFFTNSQPALLDHLSRFDRVHYTEQGSDIVLGSTDSAPDFLGAVERWIRAEQAFERIEKRAFRLPDGTIGYEYIPVASDTPFEVNIEYPACRKGPIREHVVHLCVGDESVYITTGGDDPTQLQTVDPQLLWQVVVRRFSLTDALAVDAVMEGADGTYQVAFQLHDIE